jgi:hypothetical protein
MGLPPSPSACVDNVLRQIAHRPRASDGAGNALRHIFGAVPGLPADLNALLDRLYKCD